MILFMLIITLMLSRIFSEALMSISNKHNHKTFTKSSPENRVVCSPTGPEILTFVSHCSANF